MPVRIHSIHAVAVVRAGLLHAGDGANGKADAEDLEVVVIHLIPKPGFPALAQARDVVSKEKLMRTVWADTFVTDDVLTRSISELRKIFADSPKDPRYIQTIPKGGYRLLVQPQTMRSPAAPSPWKAAPELALENPKRNLLPLLLVAAIGFAFDGLRSR